VKVRGQLKSIWPDRTQYKPYAYNLEMENVYVEIDVPDDDVEEIEIGEEKGHVLTLNGMTCLLGTIADAIDGMHIEALKSRNTRDGDSVRRNGVI
jgi:hypothetical protein